MGRKLGGCAPRTSHCSQGRHARTTRSQPQLRRPYKARTSNNSPIAITVSKFFESFDVQVIHGTQLATTPPWTLTIPSVDTSVATCVNKKESAAVVVSIVRSKLNDEYNGYVHIYTDASKTTSGRVAIGCYIQSTSSTPEYTFDARLTDGVSVYTGEMTAVKLAVENVRMLVNSTQHTKFAVFTDSLSTADSFISGRANSRPALFAETCEKAVISLMKSKDILYLYGHRVILALKAMKRQTDLPTWAPNDQKWSST